MFSRQHSTVCDIEKVKRRPPPIRVCPWKETPKGEEVQVKKFDKKSCGERTQFCMDSP